MKKRQQLAIQSYYYYKNKEEREAEAVFEL
jgi:hypothetical protein